jgi:hypothetical protein
MCSATVAIGDVFYNQEPCGAALLFIAVGTPSADVVRRISRTLNLWRGRFRARSAQSGVESTVLYTRSGFERSSSAMARTRVPSTLHPTRVSARGQRRFILFPDRIVVESRLIALQNTARIVRTAASGLYSFNHLLFLPDNGACFYWLILTSTKAELINAHHSPRHPHQPGATV